MEETCKKCGGKPPRKNQPACGTCKGFGKVKIRRDEAGKIISIEPVRS